MGPRPRRGSAWEVAVAGQIRLAVDLTGAVICPTSEFLSGPRALVVSAPELTGAADTIARLAAAAEVWLVARALATSPPSIVGGGSRTTSSSSAPASTPARLSSSQPMLTGAPPSRRSLRPTSSRPTPASFSTPPATSRTGSSSPLTAPAPPPVSRLCSPAATSPVAARHGVEACVAASASLGAPDRRWLLAPGVPVAVCTNRPHRHALRLRFVTPTIRTSHSVSVRIGWCPNRREAVEG